ncbi:putative Histidine kinase [Candidatus Terasakiella magnetica]|uniref:histidine kinase n=1 Tax=Candidatus Terasakiella magnetica TaxID=1867952 RepID=A0A1C3RCY3_9PROT|nr:HAMP domain-containing sensor histidine kinase [Candidatus Terasakiella magnetica]SCA55140.1 putative Histidine kinase [Candidatus Terasakiella magnetica]
MRRLNQRLNQLAENEKNKREETSRFLSMLGHELKTPLAVIRALLANKKITPAMIEMANKSISEIDDVVSTSQMAEKVESDTVQVNITQCDLNDMLESLTEKHHLQGSVKLSPHTSPTINSDLILLNIILSNLIENAAKYGAGDKPIEIELSDTEERDTVILSVANDVRNDNWPDPDRLFDKYHRDRYAHRVTGSGLGLYLVKGFSGLLGIDIEYQPTKTQAVFRLYIPKEFSAK